MNFPSQIFFNDINHGYKAALLKKKSLWLLPLYMAVATYFYYEKVCRTMRTAIVSNLLNDQITQKYFMNFKCKTFRNLAGFFFFYFKRGSSFFAGTFREMHIFLLVYLERGAFLFWKHQQKWVMYGREAHIVQVMNIHRKPSMLESLFHDSILRLFCFQLGKQFLLCHNFEQHILPILVQHSISILPDVFRENRNGKLG